MARKTRQPASPAAAARGATDQATLRRLIHLARVRELKRVAFGERQCDAILGQPPTDPRRPYIPRMQALLAEARGSLERGYPAYSTLAQIEALAGRMNTLRLGPVAAHAQRMRGGRKRGAVDALGAVLQEIVETLPPKPRSLSLFARVVGELRKRALGKTDGVLDEYYDDEDRGRNCAAAPQSPDAPGRTTTAGCAPGFHVHWTDADGQFHTTGEKALRARLTAITKSRRSR